MHQPIHAIGRKREMTPERVMGLGFVGVLHVVAVSAIVFGLQQHFIKPHDPTFTVDTKPVKVEPQTRPKLPVVDVKDTRVNIPPPRVVIQDDTPQPPLRVDPQPHQPPPTNIVSIPDTATVGITGSHSTPPYPLLDRRLGHEGTVTLKLAVAPDGTVSDAQVLKSSGYAGLDEAAVSWVVAHWRYKPATHGGSAIPSQATAAVMFSLHTSG
jgi:protein TonB